MSVGLELEITDSVLSQRHKYEVHSELYKYIYGQQRNNIEHDSPFEESVYNFLHTRKYKLTTQVGCFGYRIDMAVKHPTVSGKYILGIECDGASYHSSRTARERDRLRQDILENMGWKIYRIWSTDWIKDHKKEGEKLIQAIENQLTS